MMLDGKWQGELAKDIERVKSSTADNEALSNDCKKDMLWNHRRLRGNALCALAICEAVDKLTAAVQATPWFNRAKKAGE